MLVKQISIFVGNTKGRLSKITKIMADNQVNIRAMSIADTTDFGILRVIVPDPDKTFEILKNNDITIKMTDVIVLGIKDEAGGLNSALELLVEAGVNIEYMYSMLTKRGDEAYVILKTDSAQRASDILSQSQLNVLSAEDVYAL